MWLPPPGKTLVGLLPTQFQTPHHHHHLHPNLPPFVLLRSRLPWSTPPPPPLLQKVPGKQRGEGGGVVHATPLLLWGPCFFCVAPPLSACRASTPTPTTVTWSLDLQPICPPTSSCPHRQTTEIWIFKVGLKPPLLLLPPH